jgi:hypothetical protein
MARELRKHLAILEREIGRALINGQAQVAICAGLRKLLTLFDERALFVG